MYPPTGVEVEGLMHMAYVSHNFEYYIYCNLPQKKALNTTVVTKTKSLEPLAHTSLRHLRSEPSSKKCSRQPDDNTTFKAPENGDHNIGSGQERSSKVENIDDFRPTEPGHSPGAGHSIQT
ncbi:hypothetical protein V6N13_052592 [Hibiscus sabdariffa]|uniref:Uncharacterized protein n=1 Tax=Hibiscus sabdariffa TaxID=183260 RepID=A0ABR1Z9V5_9ROSI